MLWDGTTPPNNELALGPRWPDLKKDGGEVLYKGCSVPMVDVKNYDFNILTAKKLNRKNSSLTRT